MGQKYVTLEKKLRNLSLFSLVKKQLSGDLLLRAAHSSLNGNCTDGRTEFLLVLADGTRGGNSLKMLLGRFTLDFRKRLFTRRIAQQRISLPRGVTRGIVFLESLTWLEKVAADLVQPFQHFYVQLAFLTNLLQIRNLKGNWKKERRCTQTHVLTMYCLFRLIWFYSSIYTGSESKNN